MSIYPLPVIIGLTLMLMACELPYPEKQEKAGEKTFLDDSRILATANGIPITENMLKIYRTHAPAAAEEKKALEELIDLELARQDGEKRGVTKKTSTQLQLDYYRRTVVAAAAFELQLSRHAVSEEEVESLYNKKSLSAKQYLGRHILLKDKNKTEILIAELDKGADFSELARTHSIDSSAGSGGQLGWLSTDKMPKGFLAILPYLEKGEFTREPVQSESGWEIIILDDIRENTFADLEEIEPQLRKEIYSQRLQDYRGKLRKYAKIELMPLPASEVH